MEPLAELVGRRMTAAREELAAFAPAPRLREVGSVARIGDGIATIRGLSDARLDEIVAFESGARGLAIDLAPDEIGVMLLDGDSGIAAGEKAYGTGDVARVPVGEGLLGRIVDPLGRPRDGGAPIAAQSFDPIERPAPNIVARDLITESLQTGILAVDSMIPLGRGQRELIIGDRSIGKTTVAVDTILNQRRSDVVCIYAAVGQRMSSVGRVIESVRRSGPFERCIFVLADADDPPGLQWIAPYAACTMAEYFRDRGQHALLVIDDLSKHAIIHRQISLVLRVPPGREAYPGDIFYAHARLLERAAKLSPEHGGGSLTALPIAETQAGNISAYIPTNLISITDGQIYLESKLFHAGQKPAVSVGLSVSRVGGKTHRKAVGELSEMLKLDYSQFIELEIFTRFGQMVDARTQKIIDRGRRIRAVLNQPQGQPLAEATQIALLLALHEEILDAVPLDRVGRFRTGLEDSMQAECGGIFQRLQQSGELSEDRPRLLDWLRDRAASLTDIAAA